MKDYLLHTLSAGAFEGLVVRICHEILGFGTISFSSGPDGGRDAFFEGTARRFPSEADPWVGQFVIQAKHNERAAASCSESDFARILKKEAPKVAALRQAGRCDNYLLFTNRKLGALKEDELVGDLRKKTGMANVAILGKETITSYLDGVPEISQEMGLQISPFVAGLPTIPPPTRDFAGRTEELEELRRVVGKHGGALIYGVRGLGGIGKTELGLKLVELVGDDYPDGHILVELGGASAQPLSSADAMASVIRAYEPQVRLPKTEEGLRRLYHQALKDRRAILLLDDAAGVEQVEPLLPHTGCLTLVTSRQRFALPKLHRLDLDALTPEAARELLLSLAPRLDAEAESIAELLGRLPLALRLAGSAFSERPDLEPGEYLHRLERRGERVGLVKAAISSNYEDLPVEHQRLWRALAVFPGDFNVAAAAAVWAMEVDATKEVFGGALYPLSLVEYRGGRYRLHDLARDFAGSRLEEEELQTAARRHAGRYVEVLRAADRLYEEGGEWMLKGLALFDTEWGNIQAGQAWATEHADNDIEAAQYCSSYPIAGVYCLDLRLHPDYRIYWLEAGRSAAASLGNRRVEGAHLGTLGLAYAELGRVKKAIGYYEQQLVIAREIGNRTSEGNALGNLGSACGRLGKTEKAIGYCEQRLVIAREIGDQRGEGSALGNLGLIYVALEDVEKAIGYSDQALVIYRKIGDRRNEGNVLSNLSSAYAALEDVEKAIGYSKQALVIYRELGDRGGEGVELGRLALGYTLLGEEEKAGARRSRSAARARPEARRRAGY